VRHGDYQLREISALEELQACVQLQRDTWGSNFSELVPAALLRVAQKVGGITAGAFDPQDRLAGFVFGLTGVEARTPVHWSDMLAVRSDLRSQGLGEALKRYQRELLLARGIRRMYWTFDPLESRNAHLNFHRLGAVTREYRRDYYGDTDSPLHEGIGTDRLVALWELDSERVAAHLAGRTQYAPDAVRVTIPKDIQVLKAADPQRAREWRLRTRTELEDYFGQGYWITGFERAAHSGDYLLEREPFAS
jgi:predicted GNAT superfamily acetyltransferase